MAKTTSTVPHRARLACRHAHVGVEHRVHLSFECWEMRMVSTRPWDVPDGLWKLIEPMLPPSQRQSQPPHPGGRRRSGEREALSGILYVLYTGTAWRQLPPELGFGSGVVCRRVSDEWEQAGVWDRLYALLLANSQRVGETGWSSAAVDGSHGQMSKAAPKQARGQRPGAEPTRSTISSSHTQQSRSRSPSPAAPTGLRAARETPATAPSQPSTTVMPHRPHQLQTAPITNNSR